MAHISQGFRYLLDTETVIALESGDGILKVLQFVEDQPWVGRVRYAHANNLTPQPSRYLHGQYPK